MQANQIKEEPEIEQEGSSGGPRVIARKSELLKREYESEMNHGEVRGSVVLSQESNLFIVGVNRVLQIIFSLFVLCSAILCFTLEKDWFKNITASSKIPSYAMLSISISFTFIYGVIDFMQVCLD